MAPAPALLPLDRTLNLPLLAGSCRPPTHAPASSTPPGALSRMLERGARSVAMIFRAIVFTFLPTAVELTGGRNMYTSFKGAAADGWLLRVARNPPLRPPASMSALADVFWRWPGRRARPARRPSSARQPEHTASHTAECSHPSHLLPPHPYTHPPRSRVHHPGPRFPPPRLRPRAGHLCRLRGLDGGADAGGGGHTAQGEGSGQ